MARSAAPAFLCAASRFRRRSALRREPAQQRSLLVPLTVLRQIGWWSVAPSFEAEKEVERLIERRYIDSRSSVERVGGVVTREQDIVSRAADEAVTAADASEESVAAVTTDNDVGSCSTS